MQTEQTPHHTFRLKNRDIVDTAKFALLAGGVIWLLATGTQRLGYNWQWYRIPQYILQTSNQGLTWGPLMQGLGATLQITAISMVLMLAIGLLTALLRMSRSWAGRAVARIYMELIRNSPPADPNFLHLFRHRPDFGHTRFLGSRYRSQPV